MSKESEMHNPNSGIIKALLIEDEPEHTLLMREALSEARGIQFEVECADWLSTGLKRLSEGGIDVVLLDLNLPDSQGLDTLSRVRAQAPDVPVVVVTGLDDEILGVKAVQEGAQDYLVKGRVDSNFLVRPIRYSIERQRMLRKLEQQTRELQASQEPFRKIIEKNADGIIIVDKTGVILFANPAAEVLFGCKAEKLVGELFGFPIVAGETTEVDIISSGEQARIAEMQVVEIEWEREGVYLASLRDITERKKIEQMKGDFVSLVSHQLKTPVAEIKGYIDNMLTGLTGDLTARQKQYLQEMQEISSKNYRLVSDLLNASRIERGVISAHIQPVKLKDIVDLAVGDYRESIKRKGLVLNIEEMDNEIIVLADKEKMVEALSNVINNAIKFTNEGSINIRTKCQNDFGIVEVADTGKGMRDDLLSKLFRKDQLLSGSPTPEGGSGLGLYIAKEFMSLQHGDISVTSIVGKGSNFVFKIPSTKVSSL